MGQALLVLAYLVSHEDAAWELLSKSFELKVLKALCIYSLLYVKGGSSR